jgi:Diacylglycerol kinase catalytic domain
VKRALLIINTHSGSAAAVEIEAVTAALRQAGLSVEHIVQLPDEICPDRNMVEKLACDVVVVVSGDGTVASLCEKLGDWPGALLVLPGGTMNLLSRRLHGELGLAAMLEQLAGASLVADRIPIICLGGQEILTGLTVGPSTRWGEVREEIRHGDVGAIAQTVPEAWAETLADQGVWIAGQKREAYAGIFVEPDGVETLSVKAFRANNIGDMVGHGIAWLRRDFREGPSDDLGIMREVTIVGDDPETGLLIDGEREEGRLPLTCSAGMSSVRFLRISGA